MFFYRENAQSESDSEKIESKQKEFVISGTIKETMEKHREWNNEILKFTFEWKKQCREKNQIVEMFI